MIALVDCNNFYASCERVFNPKMRGLPIVVLSNNDGCVIARSSEAKVLGIQMGDAEFMIRTILDRYNIQVFSSNYALYGDMSSRVMTVLEGYTPALEVYSIDESFLDFSCLAHVEDLPAYCTKLRQKVYRHTGIPVGVRVASSKALAKAANRYAKKMRPQEGVFIIDSEAARQTVLQWLPLEDVWGIGHRNLHYFQEQHGLKTAWDFTKLPVTQVRKKMGVVGVRLWTELNGKACYKVETQPQPKKEICTSRSFPTDIGEFGEVYAAMAQHLSRSAEKLRKQSSCAGVVSVFLMTNPHRNTPQHNVHLAVQLLAATSSTFELMFYAAALLRKIWRRGVTYKKVGVTLGELVPKDQVQGSLLIPAELGKKRNRQKESELMCTMDQINRKMGRDKLRIAAAALGKKHKMLQARLSKCYTTSIHEIATVRA